MGTGIKRKKALPLFRKTIQKKLLPVATFDIETQNMGGKLLDACVTFGDGQYHHFYNERDLVCFFVSHPGYRYYAHNGAGYDFTYIMDEVTKLKRNDDFDIQPIIQGESRIIGLLFKKGKCVFELRDSLAIIPMSLKRAAHIFAPEYEKQDINLAEHIYDPTDPVDIAYLHRDCDALYHVVCNYEKRVFDLFGTSIGFTAGSTAMYAWQNHIPEGHAYYRLNDQAESFCREGYYGGLVYPGHDILVHENVYSIDMNAAYAKAMLQGVATGNPIETDVFYPQYDGMYKVSAFVPKECPLPPLPSRDKHGNLRWCTGSFQTTVTTQEILFAREQGCIVEVLWGYYWKRHEHPFDEFLALCQQLELEMQDGKEVPKIQRNALYGKFGMKTHSRRVKFLDTDVLEVNDIPFIDERIEGLGAPSPYIAFTEEENTSNYIMPHWAAMITANQRIALMRLFLAVGIENVFYGDTDCCVASKEAIERVIQEKVVTVSKMYGDVKIDKKFRTFQALGPKNYHGVLEDGTYLGKAKGIPNKKLTEWKMLMYQMSSFEQPPEFQFDSALSAFMKLKYPNKPIAQTRTRKLSTLSNSACWQQKGSTILPLHVVEVMLQSQQKGDSTYAQPGP